MDRRAAIIEQDAAALAAADPDLQRATAGSGGVSIRLRGPGFGTMIWLILGQQVSIVAARAMFTRLTELLGEVTPAGLLRLDDDTMQRCGFTRQKAGYARGLARLVQAGDDPLEVARAMPDDDAVEALTSLKGVGRWTAENYLMWAEGRRDVFPAGDLALRVGWQQLTDANTVPAVEELRRVARRWAPRRTAAAFLIWHYYLSARERS